MTTETIIAENMPTGKAPTLAALRAAYCAAFDTYLTAELAHDAAWDAYETSGLGDTPAYDRWHATGEAWKQTKRDYDRAASNYRRAFRDAAESEGR